MPDPFSPLLPAAARLAERLVAARATIAVAESSAGGLVSAAFLAVPGASAFFLGGAVIYTKTARQALLGITPEALGPIRSATEPYALLLADAVRERHAATWGLAETGAAGPAGNGYGDPPGHACLALSGPIRRAITVETAASDRLANMSAFAAALLELLAAALDPQAP